MNDCLLEGSWTKHQKSWPSYKKEMFIGLHFQGVGSSSDQSFCFIKMSSSSKICIPRPKESIRTIYRRIQPGLELQTSLGVWMFQPLNLIPRVLAHMNRWKGQFLLDSPKWDQTFWMLDVRNRSKEATLMITCLEKVLIDLSTGQAPN